MDCRKALEQLEVVRPGSNDRTSAEFRDVLAHLEFCTDCAQVFARRQSLDSRISVVSRDVPIPDGLKARLHDRLRLDQPVADEPVPSRNATPRFSRRKALRLGLSVAAGLCIGIIAWMQFGGGTARLVAVDTILLDATRADFVPSKVPSKHASRVQLPVSMGIPAGLARTEPMAYSNANGSEIATIFHFPLLATDRSTLEGVLLVLDTRRVTITDLENVKAKSFTTAEPEYRRGIAAKVWTEGELVYVCFVRNTRGPDALNLLAPHIYPT